VEPKELVMGVAKYLNFMNFLLVQLISALSVGKRGIKKDFTTKHLEN
jgi:hypothetical protein